MKKHRSTSNLVESCRHHAKAQRTFKWAQRTLLPNFISTNNLSKLSNLLWTKIWTVEGNVRNCTSSYLQFSGSILSTSQNMTEAFALFYNKHPVTQASMYILGVHIIFAGERISMCGCQNFHNIVISQQVNLSMLSSTFKMLYQDWTTFVSVSEKIHLQ